MPDGIVARPRVPTLVDRLVAENSPLGLQLAEAASIRLRQHLGDLWRNRPAPVAPWLELLTRAMHRTLVTPLRRDVDADDVCAQFASVPVLQQSDHSNLLLDAEAFVNNLLFQTGAVEVAARYAITSQCSTVVCFSRRIPPRGPVFLATRGTLFNVFGLSKTRYKNANFCGLSGPLRLRFTGGSVDAARDAVLGPLLNSEFSTGPDAYLAANELIWRVLPVDHEVCRVQVDERMTSEAIALHLEDPDSPLRALMFEPRLRDTFLTVKREIVHSPENIAVNRAEPDWLWWRRGERLHALVRRDGLRSEVDGELCSVPDEPGEVAVALRAGVLHGDRIASYLVRCLLAGAIAIGGTVQQDYVEAYRLMLLETHRRIPFLDERALALLARRDLSRLGGAPLVELDAVGERVLAKLGPNSNLATWYDDLLSRPVGDTIGGLSCAWFYDDLLRRVAARRARLTCRSEVSA